MRVASHLLDGREDLVYLQKIVTLEQVLTQRGTYSHSPMVKPRGQQSSSTTSSTFTIRSLISPINILKSQGYEAEH